MKNNIFRFFGFALILGLSACNLPSKLNQEDALSLEAQAGTLAAQTVMAIQTEVPLQTRTPENTPSKVVPTNAYTPTVSPTPSETPTPTETAHPLAAPRLKKYDFFCTWNGGSTNMEMNISWTDRSDNETGFRIYRNGEMIVELGANITKYTDLFSVAQGQVVNYAVAAYNNGGNSGQFTLSAACE